MNRRRPKWIDDRWAEIGREIKSRTHLSYHYGRAAIPGLDTIEAYHRDLPWPVGIVWYNFVGLNALQVLNSFVFENLRRCGVRTYLHERLLSAYPNRDLIITTSGTKSGLAWMKATGYKQTENGWEFHRKHRSDRR